MEETMKGQLCPICGKKTLTLMETAKEVPYFGKLYIFSMNCSSCKYSKSDVESAERKEPVKYTFEIGSDKDINVRVVKSSEATVKIPHMISMEPGPASNGVVTNVEGIINLFKDAIEKARDNSEDPAAKKKAKNMLKKISRTLWGNEKLKLIIEDPSGNSAIISDKAKIEKLKKK